MVQGIFLLDIFLPWGSTVCEVPQSFGAPVIVQNESDLYVPLENYILQGFYLLQKPARGSLRAVTAQTALIPAAGGGTWTQPDVAAAFVSRSRFATSAEIRLFGFEVKTMGGCRLQSVHEALAHTRFVNCSYVVWNRPKCICGDREHYLTIERNCSAYGIGLLSVHDPGNLATFEVRLEAQHKNIAANEVDEFISTRFDDHKQGLILGALKQFCPGPL